MIDIRTGSYYDLNNPSKSGYSADYVDQKTNRLRSLGDFETERQAITESKRFIEKMVKKGIEL